MNRFVGLIGVAWATLGVAGLLSFAIYRLYPKAVAAYHGGLSTGQWLLTGAVCVGMAYAEGYRGFQTRFSPRTAARIRYLPDRPDLVLSLFAPLFAMGFIHANRRTRSTQQLGQPWRGIVDAGVVIGLSWGVLSLAWCIVKALGRPDFEVSPEVP